MAKIIKVRNNKATDDTWSGLLLAAGTEYTLATSEHVAWSSDDKVINDAATGDLGISDGTAYFVPFSAGLNWLTGS